MLYIPLHCRGCVGEYRFSALSGPKCSQTCTPPRPQPSTPNPAYCFSEEATNVGFLLTIQRQHMLCIPLHTRGRAGEYRFSALSGLKCSKSCTPEEATNVGFLPTIQRQHMLCIPLHCRRARRSTGFQHFQAPNVPKPVLPRVRSPAPPTLLIASPKKQRM